VTDIEQADLIGKVYKVEERVHSYISKKGLHYVSITEYDTMGYVANYWYTFGIDTAVENYYVSHDKKKLTLTRYQIKKNDTIVIFTATLDSIGRVKEIVKYYSYTSGCSQMYGFYSNDGGKDLIYKETYDYSDPTGKSNKSYVENNGIWEEREVFSSERKKQRIKKHRQVVYEYFPGKKYKYILRYKEYDQSGNWTKCIKYYKRIPESVTERKIEYIKN
jgi:hypothetical protein